MKQGEKRNRFLMKRPEDNLYDCAMMMSHWLLYVSDLSCGKSQQRRFTGKHVFGGSERRAT